MISTLTFKNTAVVSGTFSFIGLGIESANWLPNFFMKHGHNRKGKITLEYYTWQGMLTRCYNKNNPKYKDYGGRGIIVCDKWKNNFKNFYEDMGNKPSPNHTIERINNDGNYEPSNCKWATNKEQSRNRRTSRLLQCMGEIMCLAEWCEIFDLEHKQLSRNIKYFNGDIPSAIIDLKLKSYLKNKNAK